MQVGQSEGRGERVRACESVREGAGEQTGFFGNNSNTPYIP